MRLDLSEHPAMQAELKFLERMVDNLETECLKVDSRPSAKQELNRARLELLDFKMKAAQKGYTK